MDVIEELLDLRRKWKRDMCPFRDERGRRNTGVGPLSCPEDFYLESQGRISIEYTSDFQMCPLMVSIDG